MNITEITGKTRLAGVMGWPIEHTLSPAMQNAAMRAMGLDWVFVPLSVAPERLAEAVAGARAMGFVGVNVTLPHKHAAATLVDVLDSAARAIGAVNVIHFAPHGAVGYNTDAYGFTRTVEVDGDFDFKDRTILFVGAGGAGRAMAAGAATAGAARLFINNRDVNRAENLAYHLRLHAPATEVEVVLSADLARAARESDLIANATSLGLGAGDRLPLAPELIGPRHVVFDAVYKPALTPLLAAAQSRGARIVPGLGMLARQGARALEIWSGRTPDETLMITVLRRELKMESHGPH